MEIQASSFGKKNDVSSIRSLNVGPFELLKPMGMLYISIEGEVENNANLLKDCKVDCIEVVGDLRGIQDSSSK